MDGKNEKSILKLAKLPSLRPLTLKSEFLLEFEVLKNYKDLYGKCCWRARYDRSAHQQYLHTNPSNFPKIQAVIKTHSTMLGASNFATFIFLTCSFHFWHLLCTTTVFHDWQGRDRIMQTAYLTNQNQSCNGTFKSHLFWQACAVKKEDLRYEIEKYIELKTLILQIKAFVYTVLLLIEINAIIWLLSQNSSELPLPLDCLIIYVDGWVMCWVEPACSKWF